MLTLTLTTDGDPHDLSVAAALAFNTALRVVVLDAAGKEVAVAAPAAVIDPEGERAVEEVTVDTPEPVAPIEVPGTTVVVDDPHPVFERTVEPVVVAEPVAPVAPVGPVEVEPVVPPAPVVETIVVAPVPGPVVSEEPVVVPVADPPSVETVTEPVVPAPAVTPAE